MGIIVSDPFSDLRGPKCGTAQKLTRFVNSQLRQVFYKGLPGFLLKNRRKIAAADSDLRCYGIQGNVIALKMFRKILLCGINQRTITVAGYPVTF